MPRPRKCRMVSAPPCAGFFKPQGIPLSELNEEVLPVEGLEALRLSDLENLDQETAAMRMGVSRPTFSRVLAEARSVVSRALVTGAALRIAGGDYRVAGPEGRGCGRGRGGGGGRRRRGMRG